MSLVLSWFRGGSGDAYAVGLEKSLCATSPPAQSESQAFGSQGEVDTGLDHGLVRWETIERGTNYVSSEQYTQVGMSSTTQKLNAFMGYRVKASTHGKVGGSVYS